MSSFVELASEDVERTVPDLFEESVARHGDRLAVRAAGRSLSYRELDRAANGVAQILVAHRGESDRPVALLIGGGVAPFGACLGAWKAGRFTVTLDVTHPPARLSELLDDSLARIVLTDRAHAALARQVAGKRTVIDVDEAAPTDTAPRRSIATGDPIYLLYTSGSTGQPKGALHSHRNVLNTIRNWTNGARLGRDDRTAMLHSHAVGGSVAGNFGALLNGAAILPFDVREQGLAALPAFLREEEITIVFSFPTLFRQLASSLPSDAAFPKLRLVRLGGEPVYAGDVALFRERFPADCVLANWFGATETHGVARHFVDRDTPVAEGRVPIGHAADGFELLLLDPAGTESEEGEIAVRSRFLALGYWRRPDLTEAAFRSAEGGLRLYRTGDLGRRSPDGCLTVLGRADDQVKVHNVRIELGEVEAAVLRHPAVSEAAVVARDASAGGPDEKRLAAYVVGRNGSAPTAPELARFLRERLPDAMVPADFVVLDRLPLLAGGKVDRRALPPPRSRPRAARSEVPLAYAHNPLWRQLAAIWEALLGVSDIDVKESFFDLGGNSLLAVAMIARVRELTGVAVAADEFAVDPTIDHLRALVVRGAEAPGNLLTPFRQGDPAKPPFFFLHGDFVDGGVYCHRLLGGMAADRPIYVLRPHPPGGPATVEEMAQGYVGLIRQVRPVGPYLIGGHCNGGLLAFEIARRLDSLGERVDLLVVIDAWLRHIPLRRLVRALRMARRRVLQSPFMDLPWAVRTEVARLGRPSLSGIAEALRRLPATLARAGERRALLETDPYRLRAYHVKAMRAYAARPYPGRVTLVRRATDNGDPTSGFGRVAANVDVRVVPGTHLTMLTEHAPELAAQLDALLREAQAGG